MNNKILLQDQKVAKMIKDNRLGPTNVVLKQNYFSDGITRKYPLTKRMTTFNIAERNEKKTRNLLNSKFLESQV